MTRRAAKPSSGLEVELKFELSRSLARDLSRAAPFKDMWVEPARKKTLRATYFDTPGLDLSGRALSLRVRKESRQFVQCFKAKPGASASDAFARLEWEWPVPGPDLDVSLLFGDPAVKKLLKGLKIDDLSPLFSTHIKRQTRLMTTPGGAAVRCDLDRGHIMSGEREVPVFELELELITGDVRDVLDMGRLLTASVPTRLSSRTKAKRGRDLACGLIGVWQKAQPVVLDHTATAHDVLCASVTQGLGHLIANEDCVLSRSHVEGVHQMRVAMRRMRAVITAYKKYLPSGCFEDLSRDLKAAGNVLGPARDLDVFLGEILYAVEGGFDDHPALNVLRAKAEHRRDKAYEQVIKYIHSAPYARLLMDVLYWVHTEPWVPGVLNPLGIPGAQAAEAVLSRHHKRLLKLGKNITTMPALQRHQLRIALKKARYAAEFFAPLYAHNQSKSYLRRLRALQDGLGHLNDLATAQTLMADLSHGTRGKTAHALNHAAGLVEGWYTHAQHTREDDLKTAWTAFAGANVFW